LAGYRLISCLPLDDFLNSFCKGDHFEKNISTQQFKTKAYPWVSTAHEHTRRPKRYQEQAQKRPQGAQCLTAEALVLMARFSFTKRARIRTHADFKKIYALGDRSESEHFKAHVLPNGGPLSRLGMTVGRQTGKAFVRNYIKRRLREYFRLHRECLPEACDIVLTAKRGAGLLSYAQICKELDALLRPKTSPDRPMS